MTERSPLEAVALAPVGQQLHRVEQGGLLVDLVEDDQARAVVQPAYGVGGDPQSLVRIVDRDIYGWRNFSAALQDIKEDLQARF